MKFITIALLAAFAIPNANAALRGSPYQPEIDQRFSDLEDDSLEQVGTARKYARAIYDVAIDGGSSTANKSLGVTLPAGAVITRFIAYTNTSFTKAGGGQGVSSLALQCNGTRNIMPYVSPAGAYKYIDRKLGVSAALSADYQATSLMRENETFLSDAVASIPTACELVAVVRGASGYEAYTAGKMTFIIEYFTR